MSGSQAKPAVAAGEPVPFADFGRVRVYLGDKNGKYPDANMMVVRGAEARAAIDAPLAANQVGADFEAADLVILSHVHEDHTAGLHLVPHTPVHVHERDAASARSWEGYAAALGMSSAALPGMRAKLEKEFFYTPRPDAIAYGDDAVFDLGGVTLRVVPLPGHTAGHCGLIVEEEGVAFIGDIDLTGFGPYYGDASSSLADFRASLTLLPNLPAKVWVTGHHRGIYTDRAAMLTDLAAYTAKLDERDARLVALLRAEPSSLDDLVAARLLYPPHYSELWVNDVERRSIGLHLEEMMAAGRVREDDGIYRLA